MSLPIKNTPTLYGEDARKFRKQIKENENKKVSPEELKRIKENYQIMKNITDKSQLNETNEEIWDNACKQTLNDISETFLNNFHRGESFSDQAVLKAIGETIKNFPLPPFKTRNISKK